MGDLLRWNENLDHPDRRRTVVRRRDADADAAHERPHDHVRAWPRSSATIRACARSVTADRRRAIGRSLRAIPTSTCRSPCGAIRASSNPTALAHQVVDLVLPHQAQSAGNASRREGGGTGERVGAVGCTYRDTRTDQTVALTATSGALSSGTGGRGGDVVRSAREEIAFAPRKVRRCSAARPAIVDSFSFAPSRTRRGIEEVSPAPATIPVADYAGTYASDELDVRFTVVARDGKLFLKRRPADEFELRPMYRDDFASGGGLGTVRFARDARGAVTGLAFFAGRVLDVRFKRVVR